MLTIIITAKLQLAFSLGNSSLILKLKGLKTRNYGGRVRNQVLRDVFLASSLQNQLYRTQSFSSLKALSLLEPLQVLNVFNNKT